MYKWSSLVSWRIQDCLFICLSAAIDRLFYQSFLFTSVILCLYACLSICLLVYESFFSYMRLSFCIYLSSQFPMVYNLMCMSKHKYQILITLDEIYFSQYNLKEIELLKYYSRTCPHIHKNIYIYLILQDLWVYLFTIIMLKLHLFCKYKLYLNSRRFIQFTISFWP